MHCDRSRIRHRVKVRRFHQRHDHRLIRRVKIRRQHRLIRLAIVDIFVYAGDVLAVPQDDSTVLSASRKHIDGKLVALDLPAPSIDHAIVLRADQSSKDVASDDPDRIDGRDIAHA